MQGFKHHPSIIKHTAALQRFAKRLFRDVHRCEREWFSDRGRLVHNPRDALWFGIPDAATGMMPLYRTFRNAYHSPRTRAGIPKARCPQKMPKALVTLLQTTLKPLGHFNHVVFHRYIDGADCINFHRDKYMDIAPGSNILSLSLGSSRRFVVKELRTGKRQSVEMNDGDAVTLSYECNQRGKHTVPATRKTVGVRYSITARHIDTFFDPARNVYTHREAHGQILAV